MSLRNLRKRKAVVYQEIPGEGILNSDDSDVELNCYDDELYDLQIKVKAPKKSKMNHNRKKEQLSFIEDETEDETEDDDIDYPSDADFIVDDEEDEDEDEDEDEEKLYSKKSNLVKKVLRYSKSKIKNKYLKENVEERIESTLDYGSKSKSKLKMEFSYPRFKKHMKCDFCNRKRNIDTIVTFARKPLYIGTQCSVRLEYIKDIIDILNSDDIELIMDKSKKFHEETSKIERDIKRFYKDLE